MNEIELTAKCNLNQGVRIVYILLIVFSPWDFDSCNMVYCAVRSSTPFPRVYFHTEMIEVIIAPIRTECF